MWITIKSNFGKINVIKINLDKIECIDLFEDKIKLHPDGEKDCYTINKVSCENFEEIKKKLMEL